MSKFQKFRTAIGELIAGKSLASDWEKGEEGSSSSGAKLITPYSQSAWIYCAVKIISDTVAQIPFRVCTGSDSSNKGEEVITTGAVVDLFDAPHPTLSRALFWQTLVSWELLRGESFIIALDKQGSVLPVLTGRGGKIARLIPLPPAMIWHIVQGYDLNGYRFTGAPMSGPIESQVLLPEEVIHSRTFNPYLYWRGMSPLEVAHVAASADYAAAQFMKGLMMNNADTGVIVTTDQQVDEPQREQIMAALRERKRKAGTPDRPLFLWGGAKVEKPAVSSADMQFLENRKLNRQEIGAIYGVPETMMGFSEQKSALSGGTAQNAERLNFLETTMTSMCRRLEDAVRPIVKCFDPNYDCYFDIDSLPVMQEARRQRVDTATKVFGMGVPFNDVNEEYDLGFRKLPWGNKGYLAFSLQEVGDGQQAAKPSDKPSDNPDDSLEGKDVRDASGAIAKIMQLVDGRHASPGHQCAANPAYESAINGAVKRTQGKIQKFFFQQRGRVLAKLESTLKTCESVSRSVGESEKKAAITKAIDGLFDMADENEKLKLLMAPLLRADLEFGGAQLFEEINAGDFALPPQDAIDYLASRANVIEGINQTTFDAIRSAVSDGLSAGEGYEAIAKRIKDLFNGWSDDKKDSRSEMIAVTETNAAINGGRFNAMQQAKVPMKAWQTSHLENTRPTHIACEEQGAIPTDGVFVNGLRFPGDPKGAAGEVINCRCFSYAVLDQKSKRIVPLVYLTFERWAARKSKLEKTS